MTTTLSTSAAIAGTGPVLSNAERLALAGYADLTREAHSLDAT